MHKRLFSVILFYCVTGMLLSYNDGSFAQCPVSPDFSFTQNCENIEFTDESTVSSGSITGWLWDFGDGNTSAFQNPSNSYALEGDYDVELTVYHSSGCDTSVTVMIGVHKPVADFSFIKGCLSDTTYFTDESVSNASLIVSWTWDFGDGNYSSLQNPGHAFNSSGSFNIKLKVMNNLGCLDSLTTLIQINDLPIADFGFTGNCTNTVINFTDLSVPGNVPINSWEWDFGDGGTSNAQNPDHMYTDADTYEVTLIVINDEGCTDTIIKPVEVDSVPVADFTYTPACVGQKTYFFDQSVPNSDSISEWIWVIDGNITITKQDISFTFDSPGSFSVNLTVINSNGCTDSKEVMVNVDYPPISGFSSDQVCFGDSTHFTNTTVTQGVPISSWLWDFDDPPSGLNNSSNLQDPVHYYTSQGNYDPFLVATNTHGCIDTAWASIPVQVDSIPSAQFQASSEAVGVPVEFFDFSIPHGSPIVQWFWTFGDGGTSPNNNPTHIYTSAGNFNVWLKIWDAEGCRDSVMHTITITALPVANFTFSTTGTSLTVDFTDLSLPSPGLQIVDWYWNFGVPQITTDTSSLQNPPYTFPESDFYDVKLTIKDSNGGISDTTKTIFVGFTLLADFEATTVCHGSPTSFTDLSEGSQIAEIEEWNWDFGDGYDTILYDTNYVSIIDHLYETSGEKSVTLVINSHINNLPISDTIQHTILVKTTPTAYFDSVSVCIGDTAFFWDESEGNGEQIVAWYWIFGDGNTMAQRHTTHIFDDSTGVYQTSLIVRNALGCLDTLTQNTWVSTIPEADFEFTTPCINTPVHFSGTYDSTSTEVNFWKWDFGDPSDTANAIGRYVDHSFQYVGLYTIELTIGNSGCITKLDKDILFYPNPFSDFNVESNYQGYSGQTYFENKSIFANEYAWDFGNGNTSDEMNPIEVYEEDTTYLVTLISSNEYGCTDTSFKEHKIVFKGLYVPTAFSPNNPNPEVARFAPKGYDIKEYLIQVFDIRGNLLWESEMVDNKGRPVESWDGYYDGMLMPQGTYIWKAQATFNDNTAWPGTIFQSSENPRRQGTLTLIR